MVTPYFLGAPLLLMDTDVLLVAPKPTAVYFAKRLPLVVLATPLALRTLYPRLPWHDRVHADAGLRWLRALIVAGARRFRSERSTDTPIGLVESQAA